MYCSQCGKELAEGSAFCPVCGAEVKTVQPADETAEPVLTEKKKPNLRKAANHVFGWLIVYNLFIMLVGGWIGISGLPTGWESVIATAAGVLLVYMATRKKWPFKPFESSKKMTAKDFFVFLGIICIMQTITLVIMLIMNDAGVEGTSIDINKNTFGMVLYAGFTGPICEELIYRGFALGNTRKYGKILAITVSAFAFGLMHMNMMQFVVGTLIGLVLGYIYVEYSIWWTILFHIINNFVFATLPELLFPNVPVETLDKYVYYIIFAGTAYGIYALIKNRREIAAYFKNPENHAPKGSVTKVFTSHWFIIYVLFYAFIIVLFMVKPEIMEFINNAQSAQAQAAAFSLLP